MRIPRPFFWAAALTGAAAWGLYRWQPLRFDLVPRKLPREHPWTEPEGLFGPGANVAIITAHPDDTEFYLAGTLLKLTEAGARLCLRD